MVYIDPKGEIKVVKAVLYVTLFASYSLENEPIDEFFMANRPPSFQTTIS